MYPDDIFLGINLYGISISVGILACFVVLFLYGKKKNVNPSFLDFTFYNAVFAIVFGFVSATLFQATYNYIENPEAGFNVGTGFTFLGGLIGGVVSFLACYFILRKKLSGRLLDIISIAPCCITIAHAFGRIGCAFAGCCHGIETDSIFAIYNRGAWRVPTQLYESAFLFIIFAIMSVLLLKKNFKYNLPVYLITYGIFRFIIEYFRADARGEIFPNVPIYPSQFWSIVMVIIGVGLIFLLRYYFNKENKGEINEQA